MEADPVDLSEEYRALLRRDWAVRVLDAWAGIAPTHSVQLTTGWTAALGEKFAYVDQGDARVRLQEESKLSPYWAGTLGDARLAAAKAVYPTLPDTVRAQLGEVP